jgi:hypothetical protein
MRTSTPPHRRQHVNGTKTVPFPSQQLFVLGTSPLSVTVETSRWWSMDCLCLPPSPQRMTPRSMACFSKLTMTDVFLLPSTLSDLRTNRLHVHLPLRLLHDPILRHHLRYSSNCNLCRHGHFCLRFRRVLIWRRMGSNQ